MAQSIMKQRFIIGYNDAPLNNTVSQEYTFAFPGVPRMRDELSLNL